jgi:hypothetical protein
MKPDRSNYEIWFIDWLDGNLNEEKVELLKVFLNENPDLKEDLDEIALISFEPYDLVFNGKKDLEKSHASYSESQFDHLCIACLENDLTPGQKAELKDIIVNDEKKRKRFELYQKLRLKPSSLRFERKSIVKKITAGQKILRWSFIGLSAAATVTVLIVAYLFIPSDLKKQPQQTARNVRPDTFLIVLSAPIIMKEQEVFSDQSTLMSAISNNTMETEIAIPNTPLAENINNEIPDTVPDIYPAEALNMVTAAITEDLIPDYRPSEDTLMAFDPVNIPQLTDDDRSNTEKFLARVFHEKITRDTISPDRPVKPFEIAEAGITGLNKLLGWEMALKKAKDENGDIKSYYFSSRLLKFNAPVKKSANNL